MNQSEFNILITNVTAIANQAFTIQCGEFATALSTDEYNEIPAENFNSDNHIDSFDFDAVIKSGYSQLADLKEELDDVWSSIDMEKIDTICKQLPDDLANLTRKVSGTQLKQWIIYALSAENDAPFYIVHQYIMSLFQSEHDDTQDLIREAIAFDELTNLLDENIHIKPEHVLLDDLITAVTIQSFKVFEWLINKAELNDEGVVSLLESSFDDKAILEKIYYIIKPTEVQYLATLTKAQNIGNTEVVEILAQLRMV